MTLNGVLPLALGVVLAAQAAAASGYSCEFDCPGFCDDSMGVPVDVAPKAHRGHLISAGDGPAKMRRDAGKGTVLPVTGLKCRKIHVLTNVADGAPLFTTHADVLTSGWMASSSTYLGTCKERP
jgi:hypothetical protein